MEVITFGGGCFWCLEACFSDIRGVVRAESGYAAGERKNPTYKEVCAGSTGHAEVVQVTFDPSVVSAADLLCVFFTLHDPTTPNRQGHDVGTQYRSIVLYSSDAQRAVVEDVMAQAAAEEWWPGKLVTQVQPYDADNYYTAEAYHQGYFANNPEAGYCQNVVAPKVRKIRSKFINLLK
ncbi:hypothetical protein FOA52_004599 [Chlamydomonas sp. UWO 241]|nr:hypothetical protein FOA52_004599 [Chlamydomonas sp. UWO 241]